MPKKSGKAVSVAQANKQATTALAQTKSALKMPTAQQMGASVENIRVVSDLAAAQIALEDRIAKGQALLEDLGRQLYKLKTVDIPTAMDAAGSLELTLKNGCEVIVTKFITANISEEDRAAAHKWLREHKFGSLIKNVIACKFGKGEDSSAKALRATLKKLKIVFTDKESVHPQTLLAFVREQLKAEKALPLSIGVVSVPTTVIKRKED